MTSSYLLGGQPSELSRLQLQSLVWEPAGRTLLADLPGPRRPLRTLDLGCGCLGWLRVLSEYVGPEGEVVGSDIDQALLGLAEQFVTEQGLDNVTLRRDDLFDSALEPGTFDLVHARFQVAPLGRQEEILAAMLSLTAPGGTVVLEDPDSSTWRFDPTAPATEALVELVLQAFRDNGGDFDAGLTEPELLRSAGLAVTVREQVISLEPGHPYLKLPLQFATSLADRIGTLVDPSELEGLRTAAAAELEDPARSGTTFTLVQTVGTTA